MYSSRNALDVHFKQDESAIEDRVFQHRIRMLRFWIFLGFYQTFEPFCSKILSSFIPFYSIIKMSLEFNILFPHLGTAVRFFPQLTQSFYMNLFAMWYTKGSLIL